MAKQEQGLCRRIYIVDIDTCLNDCSPLPNAAVIAHTHTSTSTYKH